MKNSRSRIHFLILFLFVLFWSEILFVTYKLGSKTPLWWQELLPNLHYFTVVFLLATGGAVFIILLIKLRPFHISRITQLPALLLVLVVSLTIKLNIPVQHKLHNDENLVLHYAHMINSTGRPGICELGLINNGKIDCRITSEIDLRLRTSYSVLLAFILKVFGHSELVAFAVNLIFSLAVVILVYLLTTALASSIAGIIASILVTTDPSLIWWSATTYLEIPALFFLFTSFLIFTKFTQSRQTYLFLATYITALVAAFFRPQFTIVLFSYWLFAFFDTRARLSLLASWKTTVLSLGFIFTTSLLLLFGITQRISYFDHEYAKKYPEFFGLNSLITNIKNVVIYHWQTGHILPVVTIAIAIFGFFTLKQAQKRAGLVFGSSIILLASTTFSYAWSGYPLPDFASIRFALLWYVPLLIFSGIGTEQILKKIKKDQYRTFTLIIIIVSLFIYGMHIYREFIPSYYDTDVISERYRIQEFEKANPNCLFIMELGSYELFHGYSAASYQGFIEANKPTNSHILDSLNTQCIVFFSTLSCQNRFAKECKKILSTYPWQKIPYKSQETWVLPQNLQTQLKIPDSDSCAYKPPTFFELMTSQTGLRC